MYVLGIDVGSSFVKSSVLNLDTLTLENTQSIPTPDFLNKSGDEREIPMKPLVAAIQKMIDDAVTAYPVEGIVLSAQMHGFMLFDQQGQAMTQYISWQDMRANRQKVGGQDMAARIRRMVPDKLLAQNGVLLKNTHSLSPLYAYMRQEDITTPVEFTMLGDALTRLLTGKSVPIHPTVAASSGLYSLVSGSWNKELIKALSLENVRFPDVYDGRDPVAWYTTAKADIPVYTAVGDHQAAVLGTCVGDGHIVINIGTGGQISYIDKGLRFGIYETRPYFDGRTLRALTQLPSGRSLNVLMKFVQDVGRQVLGSEKVTESEIWGQINCLVAEVEAMPSTDPALRLDLSFFDSAAPEGGSIKGIGSNNLLTGNLFYSAYASMADEYCQAYRQLLSDSCGVAMGIACTGGVMRKVPLLQEMIGKRIGVACVQAPFQEDTMIGLMRLALSYKSKRPVFSIPFQPQ